MGISKFKERYDRNFNTLSLEEQKKLGASKVVVLGLGGLGGSVCEMLARVGIGHLILIDGDVFDSSNLNRQLLCQEKLIGFPKAKAAEKRIASGVPSPYVLPASKVLKMKQANGSTIPSDPFLTAFNQIIIWKLL